MLVLAGSADARATPDEARAIVEQLGPRAELVVVEGGDHLRLPEANPHLYRGAVLDFLKQQCSPVW